MKTRLVAVLDIYFLLIIKSAKAPNPKLMKKDSNEGKEDNNPFYKSKILFKQYNAIL